MLKRPGPSGPVFASPLHRRLPRGLVGRRPHATTTKPIERNLYCPGRQREHYGRRQWQRAHRGAALLGHWETWAGKLSVAAAALKLDVRVAGNANRLRSALDLGPNGAKSGISGKPHSRRPLEQTRGEVMCGVVRSSRIATSGSRSRRPLKSRARDLDRGPHAARPRSSRRGSRPVRRNAGRGAANAAVGRTAPGRVALIAIPIARD